MKKPKSYHVYKHDPTRHRYDYTHEEHQSCIAYEQKSKDRIQDLDFEMSEGTIKIEKVNGVVVNVITAIPVIELAKAINYLSNKP